MAVDQMMSERRGDGGSSIPINCASFAVCGTRRGQPRDEDDDWLEDERGAHALPN